MNAVNVVVVGAGWSGLACALACVEGGARVTVLDAAPQAGGRARAVSIELGNHSDTLDNGQHLLIGAYRDTERLMRKVGVDPARALLRMPLSLIYPDGFRFTAAPLPAPLNLAMGLLTARGLTFNDRLALIRLLRAWKRSGWSAPAQATARDVLTQATPTLIERLLEPLCLAALNLRLHEASATIFLRVLRDSIGGSSRASELWVPRVDLSTLFPHAAIKTLTTQGAQVRLHTLVTSIAKTQTGWKIQTRTDALECDTVVLALPPERARPLLESVNDPALHSATQALAALQSAPIATVYLRYAPGTRLPHPVMALRESPTQAHYGQWAFDRGALDARHDGVVAVVISGHGAHLELPHDTLAHTVAQQLSATLALPTPRGTAVLVDRRATLLAVPGLRRPPVQLPVRGLYLAGDAADSPYPSTLEGSVRTGLEAADLAHEKRISY